jgi:hypothetical protein
MYKIIQDRYTDAPCCIKRLSDNAFIPLDPANSDYAEFLVKQAEGVKVYAADETLPEGETT